MKRSLFLRHRARRRGAAFIEALIVISLLILGFLGLVFFRELYTRQLIASRLARASVIAYSMSGCGNDNQPGQWVGMRDMARYTSASPNHDRQSASDNSGTSSASGTEAQSTRILGDIGATSGDGKGLINPITNTDFSGHTKVDSRSGGFASRRKTFFESQVRSRSFVSCGEPVRKGEFDQVISYVRGMF